MIPSLREFPYPYRCALAISSDIDNASSHESFIAIMDYLNSTSDTSFGPGLGLEIGNSFWFFNSTDNYQLSYFKGLTSQLSSFAPVIRELWESGHIDTIHSWGNFDKGGFSRSFAEMGLKEDLREIKKNKDFSSKREEILSMIWNMEEEIMGKEN